MEQMTLHQCFNPACPNGEAAVLHPLTKEVTVIPQKDQTSEVEQIRYRMACDECHLEWYLVRERHKTGMKSEDNPEENVVMERIYATDVASVS